MKWVYTIHYILVYTKWPINLRLRILGNLGISGKSKIFIELLPNA